MTVFAVSSSLTQCEDVYLNMKQVGNTKGGKLLISQVHTTWLQRQEGN